MAQELKIDGKLYEPSTAVAGAFGYTADYVSKLARDGKVLAQQVGRQWYVERDSLTTFSHQASKQKIVRSEELRKKRKLERVARTQVLAFEPRPLPNPTHAFANAVMLFMVVAVAACVGLVAFDEGVGLDDFKTGSATIVADVTSLGHAGVVTGDSQVAFLGWLKRYWFKEEQQPVDELASPEAIPSLPSDIIATNETGLVLLDPATDDEVVDAVRTMFSDPVDVRQESDDSGYLTPVFKERTDESYRFLLVPVHRSNE